MKNWSNKSHEEALNKRRQKERERLFALKHIPQSSSTVTITEEELTKMNTVTIDGIQVRYGNGKVLL